MKESGWWLVVACAIVASCSRPRDNEALCREQLAAKTDAVAACRASFGKTASVDAAKALVKAYTARGDGAVEQLLAQNPGGPLAAEIWHQRARTLGDAGDSDASIRAFQRALLLRGTDPSGRVRELLGLAERYERKRDSLTALAIASEAFDIARASNDAISLAHARVNFAIELTLLGSTADAIRIFDDAAGQLPTGDAFLEPALLEQGELEHLRGHDRLAHIAWQRLVDGSDESYSLFATHNLIDLALALGDVGEAARLLGREHGASTSSLYRARVAIAQHDAASALDAATAGLRDETDSDIRGSLETVRGKALELTGSDDQAIDAFERSIAIWNDEASKLALDELKLWTQTDVDRRAPFEHLFAIYARRGNALDALAVAERASGRALFDGIARAQVSGGDVARVIGQRAVALQRVARSLRISDESQIPPPSELARDLATTVVWTYFVANGELWLVALDRGSASLDDLGPVKALQTDIDAAQIFDEAALARLGSALAPAARWRAIDSQTIVHIATSAPLDRLPFAALRTGERRWIERAAIAYVPSAAVLHALERQPARARTAAIVIGDPTGDLAGARAEAAAAASSLGVPARASHDATVASVLGAAQADVLVVASHADVGAEGASLRMTDGAVTTGDIIDKMIAPREVVLTSCASAATNADAWGAVAGAFLAAGSQNVVASRAALDDALSRELMADFFASGGAHSAAVALASAQRAAIAKQVAVSAWSTLVVLGTGH